MLHCSSDTLSVYQTYHHVRFVCSVVFAVTDKQKPRAPETYDIVNQTISVQSRKNLAQVSRILEQISLGTGFSDEHPCYVPVNEYVRKAIAQMSTWLFEGE